MALNHTVTVSDDKGKSTEWHPLDSFNETNAKRLSLVIIVVVILLNTVRHHVYPHDTCDSLLRNGSYLGPGVWQPEGCTMHHYTLKDIPRCLTGKRIVFVGDSRIRQLYFAFVKSFTLNDLEEAKFHSDTSHHEKETDTTVEFWWQPEVNDSTIEAYQRRVLEKDKKPALLVHGVGAWTIRLSQGEPEGFSEYQKNLTKLAPVMESAAKMSNVVWMLQAPVQEDLLSEERKVIGNHQITTYNMAAVNILSSFSHVKLWHSSVTTGLLSYDDTLDGLHASQETNAANVQVLLNRFCNPVVKPSDGSCCTLPPDINTLQVSTFLFFFANLLLAIFFKIQLRRRHSLPDTTVANHVDSEAANQVAANKSDAKEASHWLDTAYNCTSCLVRFGLVMLYTYLCDRTDLFEKRHKHFSSFYFFFPLGVAMLMCLFFHADVRKPTVLNLEQTKEWKGWMQLVILIYHYTGASKVIPIYMQLRLMVASYLFMTAYGQFSASWDKKKFGLARVCNVIFRMNLLVVFLCLVMDRQYQLYYFVPLVSFWFLVIYTTMAIFPRVTRETAEANPRHYLYMLLKLLMLVAVIVLLSVSRVTFNLVFEWWPFSELFVWPGTSIYEWWFRWNLDKFIVPYGILFGFALLTARSCKWLDDSHSGNLFSLPITIIIQIVAAVVFLGCTYHSYLCTSKPECNRGHTYISFMPVTAFIILRNTSGFLRRKFSVFAAWFGDISLELFISQYHIWLAQDTKSLLVLVPGFPALNLLVTSFLFVCIAVELKDITGVLTSIAIPNEPRKLYARLVGFTAFLILLLVYTNFVR